MSTLTDKPCIFVIKAGSVKMNNLSQVMSISGLNSHISEQTVTNKESTLVVGHFTMKPGEEFTFDYDAVECKVVTKGKIVVRDKADNKYTAEAGDLIVFSPDVTVRFDGESDGEAIYVSHRALIQDFAPLK